MENDSIPRLNELLVLQGSGHFPESAPYTEPASNAYFPAENGNGNYSDSAYICSPHSTLVVVIVIILVLNVAMVAAFVIFYRYVILLLKSRQKKGWLRDFDRVYGPKIRKFCR